MALTGRQEEAAALVAADLHTDLTIAQAVGVGRTTLHKWKQLPAFQAAVEASRAAYRAVVRDRGIAVVENRVAALQDRWTRMQQVIRERAEDESMTGAGSSTGLLVRKYKQLGQGEFATMVEEYEVDTGLLKEMREHEKQAAQELGQWLEKTETKTTGHVVITSIRAVQPTVRATEGDE